MAAIWLGLSLMLSGCGGAPADSSSAAVEDHAPEPGDSTEIEDAEVPTASSKKGKYAAPELLLSEYRGKKASKEGQIEIDESGVEDGYVGFSVKADAVIKIQVMKDGGSYMYTPDPDGTPSIFPLQMGDGKYEYKVWENVDGTTFSKIGSGSFEVSLKDEFSPYLRPSDYVKYDKASGVVKKSRELAKTANTQLDVVKAVYKFVTENIKYDSEKAENPSTDIPATPDETLKTGYGICLDYASLAAALLRAQGIPTKMIYGDVGEDDLYHAWNMFYTEETGWVTVDFKIKKKNSWYRLDLTFSAGGASMKYVGDGTNYRDLYTY